MLKRSARWCYELIIDFLHGNGPSQAAGLSYVSLLSLVPLLTVAFAIMSVFPEFSKISAQVQQYILDNFIASSAQLVQQHIHEFMSHTKGMSATGVLFLFVTSVMMVFSLEAAFNNIWHVTKRRNFLQAFLVYWAVITLAPVLITVGVFVTHPLLSKAALVPGVQVILNAILPYIVTFLVFSLLYVAVPNRKVRFRDAAIGAAVATVFFELLKRGFTVYMLKFPTYKLIYGALAAVPIFLLWLYLSWLIILFGCLISYVISPASMKKT